MPARRSSIPRIFAGAPAGPHSLNRYFDEAIAEGRLFGLTMRRPAGSPSARPTPSRSPRPRSRGRLPERHERAGASARLLASRPERRSSRRWPTRCCRAGWFPDFRHDGDPLTLADATIYVPTRRAARELRARLRREFGRRLGDPADGQAARRVRRGRGGLRRGGRRRARPCAADRRHRPAAASGAAGARLEEAAAGACRGAVRRGDGRAGFGGRRHLAGARPCRADGRDRDGGLGLDAACASWRLATCRAGGR